VDFQEPETRREFWMKKINSNVKRDKIVNEQLQTDGWKVVRFWEHEVRKKPETVVQKIVELLKESPDF
jgi:DNA mismatch endonuclease (patch repair protein)